MSAIKVEIRTWPFALRRLCGKWYTLALLAFTAASAITYFVIHDDEMLIISLALGIIVLYGGAAALASYCGTREQLDPIRRSLWEIRDGRIPVLTELQKYAGLAIFVLLSPLILVMGLDVMPRLLLVLGIKDEMSAAAFTALAPALLILFCLYVLFRWETARNWRRDTANNTPRALYLRSFSENASPGWICHVHSRRARNPSAVYITIFLQQRLVLEKIAQRLRFLTCPLELPPWRLLAGQVTYQPSLIDKPRSGADFDLNQARTELFMIMDQECPHRSRGVLEFAVRVIAMTFKAQQTGGQSVDQCLPFEERRVRCTT